MKRIPPLWSRCPPSPGIEMRMGGVRVEMKGEGQVSAQRRQIADDGGCTDWLPSSSPSLSRYNHTRPESLKPTRGLGQWVRISQSPNKGKSRPFHLTNPMTTLLSTSNSEDWAEYPAARLEPGAEHARIATELERQRAAGHGPLSRQGSSPRQEDAAHRGRPQAKTVRARAPTVQISRWENGVNRPSQTYRPDPPPKIKAQILGYPPADLGLSRVLRLVGADGFEPPTSAL
ncbi:hypothetical protein SAMN05446589_5960 [Streptomyces sp. OV198]|nr:hypothetical protein SAMN05446589_5960 [Streptomyces sp. OV198]